MGTNRRKLRLNYCMVGMGVSENEVEGIIIVQPANGIPYGPMFRQIQVNPSKQTCVGWAADFIVIKTIP